MQANAQVFDGDNCVFFGVLPDAESYGQAQNQPPLRWFGDLDGEVRRIFGAVEPDGAVRPQWMLLDPSLRLMGVAPLSAGPSVIGKLAALGPPPGTLGSSCRRRS